MGFVKAVIEIANSFDMGLARRGKLTKEEIRKQEVEILIDTGAYNLSINENLATQLGLEIVGSQSFELADGEIKMFNVAEPVEIRFKNRTTSCNPIILQGNTEMTSSAVPLLGRF
jgi:predicted aspartyl protease